MCTPFYYDTVQDTMDRNGWSNLLLKSLPAKTLKRMRYEEVAEKLYKSISKTLDMPWYCEGHYQQVETIGYNTDISKNRLM